MKYHPSRFVSFAVAISKSMQAIARFAKHRELAAWRGPNWATYLTPLLLGHTYRLECAFAFALYQRHLRDSASV
jgi:hypothetical protein